MSSTDKILQVEKSDIATIDKKKYLVPVVFPNVCRNQTLIFSSQADLTVGQFVYVIRKRIKLSPEKV